MESIFVKALKHKFDNLKNNFYCITIKMLNISLFIMSICLVCKAIQSILYSGLLCKLLSIINYL